MYVYIYIYINTYIYICHYILIPIYICNHVYIYTNTCIYIYIHHCARDTLIFCAFANFHLFRLHVAKLLLTATGTSYLRWSRFRMMMMMMMWRYNQWPIWGFLKSWGIHKSPWVASLMTWMIWGYLQYPHFRKPPLRYLKWR